MEEAQTSGSAQAKVGAVCCYARCGAGLKKPLVCSQCKAAAYCSKNCQVKDWKAGHKQACKGKMRKERDGAAVPEPTDIRLLVACAKGDMETVERLLEEGVRIDMQDKDGITALMVASENGHGEVVEKLLGKGASVDVQDKDGFTALMRASGHGHREVVEKLLGKGARVDVQCKNGATALLYASVQGHEEVVEKLVGKGASMKSEVSAMMRSMSAREEVQDGDGDTALMAASGNDQSERVEQQRKADLMAAELLRKDAEGEASKRGKSKAKGKNKKKKQKGGAQGNAAAPAARGNGDGTDMARNSDSPSPEMGESDGQGGVVGERPEALDNTQVDLDLEGDAMAIAGASEAYIDAEARFLCRFNSTPPAAGAAGAKPPAVASRALPCKAHPSPPAAMGAVAAGQGVEARCRGDRQEVSTGDEPSPGSCEAVAGAPAAAEEVECCVCLESRKSHIFIPCGHFCACQRCADEIMSADKPACPMCRQAATTCTRVYG